MVGFIHLQLPEEMAVSIYHFHRRTAEPLESSTTPGDDESTKYVIAGIKTTASNPYRLVQTMSLID
jgi:hypothetical protein